MTAPAFSACRHRGAAADAGVHHCHSPKLVGLKLVTPELCRDCYCRDHAASAAPPGPPPRLAGCAYLGADTGRRAGGAAVHECRHPAHRDATEAGCRTCPDYLFPAFSPRTPVRDVRRHLDLPPRPQPNGWWHWPNVREAQRRAAADLIAATPACPRRFRGRGVVIAGGGPYFACAYVTVRVLRHVGCALPVELWHLDGEIDAAMRRLLRPLGVRCVNADAVVRRRPFRFLHGHWWKGWQLKPYAVAHSSFREVLFLDADCYPTRDPSFLFDWPRYREWGAIFWPDIEASRGLFTPELWALFGVPPEARVPFESGQLLVNKGLCSRELNLALHYNGQADFTYRILWGDKDTFLVAWRRLGRDYGMMWPTSGWDTHTILQYDDRGEPLFLHRCRDKWRLTPADFRSTRQQTAANQYNPRLAHEDFCFRVLEELGKKWSPGAPVTFADIDGWFNFADVYDLALGRAEGGECFVEVGSWLGRSTAYMAERIKSSGKPVRFFAVDNFRGSPGDAPQAATLTALTKTLYETFCANLEACGVREYVTPLVMDSADAARTFGDGSIDFCFIDADHSYERVLEDIRPWLPKIKPGGVLAGDDFGWEGVGRAVRECFGGRFRLSRGPYKSWIVEVPVSPETDRSVTRGAIVTVDRTPENYLAATLASARSNAGGPVCFDLFVNDERTAYVQECDRSLIGRVDALPAHATAGLTVHRSHTLNYSRALLHHGLILEDDVIFCPEWDAWLWESVDRCQRRTDGRFALALYSCYSCRGDSLVADYPVEAFFGFQAMYFPPAVRTPFYLHLLRNFGREPTDLLLKSFCQEQGVSLLACSQSLVQHVGRKTTGLGHFHQTRNFRGR